MVDMVGTALRPITPHHPLIENLERGNIPLEHLWRNELLPALAELAEMEEPLKPIDADLGSIAMFATGNPCAGQKAVSISFRPGCLTCVVEPTSLLTHIEWVSLGEEHPQEHRIGFGGHVEWGQLALTVAELPGDDATGCQYELSRIIAVQIPSWLESIAAAVQLLGFDELVVPTIAIPTFADLGIQVVAVGDQKADLGRFQMIHPAVVLIFVDRDRFQIFNLSICVE